jgi:peptidoglycan/xylan/chitin deacetylase (PgdA/CDA1 family)
VLLLATTLLLTGCTTQLTAADILGRIFVVNTPPSAIATPVPTFVPTLIPTPTPELPKEYDIQRQQIRELMEGYGFVQQEYLTNTYWDRLYARIAQFGAAERIAAFELHGNNYSMYDGLYAMNPETFYEQMTTMMTSQYHFVTIHELQGFLEGWLDLPKRSIILTTDSGGGSKLSFESITAQFMQLEREFGYKPHMQSYIWTMGMRDDPSADCDDKACWGFFLQAKESGFFTFGTHSHYHLSLGAQTASFLRDDLRLSKQIILRNTGLDVYGVSWPNESCSRELDILRDLGISFGFGGFSRSGTDLFVRKADGTPSCLPRIFPPNPAGYSSRPAGLTLEQILASQEN